MRLLFQLDQHVIAGSITGIAGDMEIRRGDSLFFVPAKYLPYVFFALGAVVAFAA